MATGKLFLGVILPCLAAAGCGAPVPREQSNANLQGGASAEDMQAPNTYKAMLGVLLKRRAETSRSEGSEASKLASLELLDRQIAVVKSRIGVPTPATPRASTMKSKEIIEEMQSLGAPIDLSDNIQGRLVWINVNSYGAFSDIAAIRSKADWDVSARATAQNGHSLTLSIAIDEAKNTGRLSLGLAVWKFPLTGEDIKVINNATTAELLVKFNKSLIANEYREPVTMSQGSYVVVKDN